MKSLAIFLHTTSRYAVLDHFSRQLGQALMRQGISCRFFDQLGPAQMQQLQADPPCYTLSYNGMPTTDDQQPLTAISGCPHIAYLVDPLHHYLSLAKFPIHLAVADRSQQKIAREMKIPALFLPHAASASSSFISDLEPTTEKSEKKCIDVSLFSTFIDYEASDFAPPLFKKWIERIAARFFNCKKPSYLHLFLQCLQENEELYLNFKSKEYNPYDFLALLELYIKGLDRLALIRSIKNSEVHIFGSAREQCSWQQALKGQSNLIFHPPLQFEQVLKTMASAKIVLNSCPTITDGAHERIFSALLKNCYVISSHSAYLRQQFQPQQGLFCYRYPQIQSVDPYIQFLLKNPAFRQKAAAKGALKVRSSHTYDQRARALIAALTTAPLKCKN